MSVVQRTVVVHSGVANDPDQEVQVGAIVCDGCLTEAIGPLDGPAVVPNDWYKLHTGGLIDGPTWHLCSLACHVVWLKHAGGLPSDPLPGTSGRTPRAARTPEAPVAADPAPVSAEAGAEPHV